MVQIARIGKIRRLAAQISTNLWTGCQTQNSERSSRSERRGAPSQMDRQARDLRLLFAHQKLPECRLSARDLVNERFALKLPVGNDN
jgi:hypothetical protein